MPAGPTPVEKNGRTKTGTGDWALAAVAKIITTPTIPTRQKLVATPRPFPASVRSGFFPVPSPSPWAPSVIPAAQQFNPARSRTNPIIGFVIVNKRSFERIEHTSTCWSALRYAEGIAAILTPAAILGCYYFVRPQ
jgi:hypothetical protein